MPKDQAEACVGRLHALGYTHAAVIGEVTERNDGSPPITIA
jgi:hydrogenase maturation factor